MQSNERASKKMIEETQRLYAALIPSRLQLDERSLMRPSFGFIHELIRSLVAETRILRDVFKPVDLQPISPPATATGRTQRLKSWDRRAKTEFCQKLIDFVAANKQPVLSCSATKIVAGLEPNRTNELLQALARIASQRNTARGKKGIIRDQSAPLAVGQTSNRSSASSTADRPQTFTRSNSRSSRSSMTVNMSRKPSVETQEKRESEPMEQKENPRTNNPAAPTGDDERRRTRGSFSVATLGDADLEQKDLDKLRRGLSTLEASFLSLVDDQQALKSYLELRLT